MENGHVAVGRYDVDVVGRHGDLIHCLHHRHDGGPLQDFGEDAGVTGIEMRHQHKGQTAVWGHCAEELFEGLQAAGGSAQADDAELPFRGIP